MRAIIATLAFIILCTACTSAQRENVQVPTLAVLPTETYTHTPLPTATDTATLTTTPTVTNTPSSTPSATWTASPTLTNSPVWTFTPNPTSTPECDGAKWWRNVEPMVQAFLDTAEVAAQTSRVSLSGVILEMRQAQREFERVDYPDCMRKVYSAVSSGMRNATDGFTSFMGENEISSSIELSFAAQYFWNAQQLLHGVVLLNEYRMFDAAALIWGGDSPNEATATWLAATIAPTATPGRCTSTELGAAQAWQQQLLPIFDKLAAATQPTEVKSVHDAVEALAYPPCLQTARQYLLSALNSQWLATISASPTTMQGHLDDANASSELFLAEINRLFPTA
jgi:hypothetical protein